MARKHFILVIIAAILLALSGCATGGHCDAYHKSDMTKQIQHDPYTFYFNRIDSGTLTLNYSGSIKIYPAAIVVNSVNGAQQFKILEEVYYEEDQTYCYDTDGGLAMFYPTDKLFVIAETVYYINSTISTQW